MPARPDLRQRLGFMAGDQRWLVALDHLSGVEPWPRQLSPVPFCHDWVLGVAPVHGVVVTVIDWARFMGAPPRVPDRTCRLLVLQGSPSPSALVATALRGLLSLAEMSAVADSSKAAAEPPWVAGCWRDATGELWRELTVPALTAAPAFLQIERGLIRVDERPSGAALLGSSA